MTRELSYAEKEGLIGNLCCDRIYPSFHSQACQHGTRIICTNFRCFQHRLHVSRLPLVGGPKEPCTDAVGVMSNPEIMRKLSGKISSGKLDTTAAVKTLKFGRTWLTYDDVDTWKLKLDFARSQCLGGAMVWAISQDTSDGKLSKQLKQATGYKSKGVTTLNTTKSLAGGVFMETTESEANAGVSDDQCRWTDCAETCPSRWSTVPKTRSLQNKLYGDYDG